MFISYTSKIVLTVVNTAYIYFCFTIGYIILFDFLLCESNIIICESACYVVSFWLSLFFCLHLASLLSVYASNNKIFVIVQTDNATFISFFNPAETLVISVGYFHNQIEIIVHTMENIPFLLYS